MFSFHSTVFSLSTVSVYHHGHLFPEFQAQQGTEEDQSNGNFLQKGHFSGQACVGSSSSPAFLQPQAGCGRQAILARVEKIPRCIEWIRDSELTWPPRGSNLGLRNPWSSGDGGGRAWGDSVSLQLKSELTLTLISFSCYMLCFGIKFHLKNKSWG